MRPAPTSFLVALLLTGALAGCGSDAPPVSAAETPDAAPTAAPAVAADATSPATPPSIRFPRDVAAPVQGGGYVAVVLATGSDEEIQASLASVAQYGYEAGISDVACLSGAAKRLDLDGGALVSSLLFADARTARRFADAYIEAEDGLMVGRAAVTAYCLD